MEWQENGITIVDDRNAVDTEFVCDLLRNTYWAKERSREAMKRSFGQSLCFSVFQQNQQIGFGRVVSDYATFSWIADVIIDSRFRGQGTGKFLMRCITEHPSIKHTTQTLATRDAHGLYEQFGFVRQEFMRKEPENTE